MRSHSEVDSRSRDEYTRSIHRNDDCTRREIPTREVKRRRRKSKDRRTFERATKKSLGKERTSGSSRRMYTNMASSWRTVVSVRDVGFGGVCRIDSAHESARTPTSVIVATWPPP